MEFEALRDDIVNIAGDQNCISWREFKTHSMWCNAGTSCSVPNGVENSVGKPSNESNQSSL